MLAYLISSLRNEKVPEYSQVLRDSGIEVFDDWFAAGPIADDCWQEYETNRGHTYPEALQGWAAKHVFEFDKYHLERSDIGILLMPAGKSGHLELGWMLGKGKPGYVLFPDGPPDRFDVMYQFANGVYFNIDEMIRDIKNVQSPF